MRAEALRARNRRILPDDGDAIAEICGRGWQNAMDCAEQAHWARVRADTVSSGLAGGWPVSLVLSVGITRFFLYLGTEAR